MDVGEGIWATWGGSSEESAFGEVNGGGKGDEEDEGNGEMIAGVEDEKYSGMNNCKTAETFGEMEGRS